MTTMYVLMKTQRNWDDPDVCYPIGVFATLDDAKDAADGLQDHLDWRDPFAVDGETFVAVGKGYYAGEYDFPIYEFEVGQVKQDETA